MGVKKHRSWVSLLAFCIGAVLAFSVGFATVIAGASVAVASHQMGNSGADDVAPASPAPEPGTTFTGMITDSHCGARHIRNSHQNAAECARACFRRGASYVLVDGERRYTLVGEENALGKLAGERVSVRGTRQGDAILVNSAAVPVF